MIDVNAYLGHFAFRRLAYPTAASLVKLMDAKGIDRAVVSSASAITYRNPQPGNEDLAADVKPFRDRLIPYAVVNPAYAGWQDDLAFCRDTLGMRGLRLYPQWHGYSLADSLCLDLVSAAAERGMLISIPIRVEDPRQRSWLVDVPDLSLDAIAKLIQACPRARFILLNGIRFESSTLGRSGLASNYLIEISRLSALLENDIGQLIASLGAERLVLGTGMPFSYPDPALLKLEVLQASKEDKDKIGSLNAAKWLRESGAM